jgi:hypothetical protein
MNSKLCRRKPMRAKKKKKETIFFAKNEFRVVQRNAQRVDFEKC